VAFRLWLNDRSLRSGLLLLAACALVPVVVIMLAFEVQVRITHRSRRKLKLGANHVSVSPAKYNRVAFDKIRAWRLEPVADAPEFSKLTLEYSLDKKAKLVREWSMVLRSEQERAFLAEMEQLGRTASTATQVVRLTQPLARKKVNRRLRSTAALALGFYFLIHGLPVLSGSLFPSSEESDQSRRGSRQFTVRERARLRQFVAQHFASPEEFRKFMIITAGSLTVLGAGLYFWGLSAIKKKNALAAAEGEAAARGNLSNSEAVWAAVKR